MFAIKIMSKCNDPMNPCARERRAVSAILGAIE